MTEVILKPCSECDCADPEYYEQKRGVYIEVGIYGIKCPKCFISIIGHDKEIVINKWNRGAKQ